MAEFAHPELLRVEMWIAVLVGFAGVIVVARPGGSTLPLLGVAVGLAAALGQATVTITLRRLQHSENVAAIVFWFSVGGTLAGAVLLPFFGQWHDLSTVLLVIAGGLAGGVAQLLMTSSLRAPVSAVTPFDYLQIVGAILLGWLLLGTTPSAYTILGAALVAGSGIYTAWREHVRRRAAAALPPVPVS